MLHGSHRSRITACGTASSDPGCLTGHAALHSIASSSFWPGGRPGVGEVADDLAGGAGANAEVGRDPDARDPGGARRDTSSNTGRQGSQSAHKIQSAATSGQLLRCRAGVFVLIASTGPSCRDIVGSVTIFTIVTTNVIVLAALLTSWLAYRALREARRTTDEARKTVAAIEALLPTVREAAAAAEASAKAAGEAALIADQARREAGQERDERRLLEIAELVERVFWKAAEQTGYQPVGGGFRAPEQNALAAILAGSGLDLPECVRLAGEGQASQAFGSARDARNEVTAALSRRNGREIS